MTAPTDRCRTGTTAARKAGLTEAEERVLGLLVDGASNREIGQSLRITEHTVKCHVARILDKLSAPNRTAAAAIAIRNQLA